MNARVDPGGRQRVRLAAAAAVLAVITGATFLVAPDHSRAGVSPTVGLAFNYYTNMGFNGDAPTRFGHGGPASQPAESVSPSVTCPASGGKAAVTDPDGARASYLGGGAVVFGGKWPEDASEAPPSGPLKSSVDCQAGPYGYVKASTSATLMPSGSSYPGGIGPDPFFADRVTSSCSATASGVTGGTTVTNGHLVVQHDQNGAPTESEPVPVNPSVNYTRSGAMNHTGDSYRIVFNEQVLNDDGSLTVTAARLYMLGPFADGEVVVGQVTCGVDVSGDLPRCEGEIATVVGTSGRDELEGTPNRDVIVAGEGSDKIVGYGGNDLICAGGGHDYVYGRGGADTLLGGNGNDHLYGGDGRDDLRGGPGDDNCVGGRGEDTRSGC